MALVRSFGWRGCSVLLLVHAIACSDDGVPATSEHPSDGGTTGTATMSGTDGTDPSMSATTAESSVTDTSPESSGSSLTATTDDDTSATATSPTTDPSADTSATGTSGPDTDSTTGDPSEPCTAPSECQVVDTCCECTAIPADAEPPMCEENCEQSVCAALGIDPIAQCELGSCELAPVPCNALEVTCEQVPPECPDGTLPGVDPQTMCWTDACVPAEYCDVVSSCADCAADEACVELIAHFPTVYCTPIPEECNGEPTCACMGDQVCESPFDLCVDDGPGIQCQCPAC